MTMRDRALSRQRYGVPGAIAEDDADVGGSGIVEAHHDGSLGVCGGVQPSLPVLVE
jgi:hypothetical protein